MNSKLIIFWVVSMGAIILSISTADNKIEYLTILIALFLAAIAGALNYSDLEDRYESR